MIKYKIYHTIEKNKIIIKKKNIVIKIAIINNNNNNNNNKIIRNMHVVYCKYNGDDTFSKMGTSNDCVQ